MWGLVGGLGGGVGKISCSSSRCLGVANSAGWIPGESSKRPGRRKRKRGNEQMTKDEDNN